MAGRGDDRSGRQILLRNLAASGGLWQMTACLVFCVSVFVWASQRGYDISDEAHYLISIAVPFQYHYAISEFGYLLHPLYMLTGGNVAALRDIGLAGLCGSGLTFGWATARFILPRVDARIHYLVAAAVTTCVFWQFDQALLTPNYNELNLCALLLFFAALLFATPDSRPADERPDKRFAVIAPGIVAGAALAVIALDKPTSGVLAMVLGLAWVWLLRPPAPWLAVATAGITAAIVFLVTILAIDGSVTVFVGRKLTSLALLRARGTSGGIHGLESSILGPFAADRRWKILPALSLSALLFAMNAVAFEIVWLRQKTGGIWRRLAFTVLAISMGILTAWWRTVPVKYPDNSPAYHAWYFAMPLILAAAVFTAGRRQFAFNDPHVHRTAAAAFLLALAPLAYSFGTDVVIFRHMSGAAVFWAASALLVMSLVEPMRREALLSGCAVLCGAATVGMFVGVMAAPGRIGQPIWKQTEEITIGANGAHVLVDMQTAAYIRKLQSAAVAHRLRPGMRVIDLSELGPGMVFALPGVVAPGTPWLHVGGSNPMAFAREILETVPQPDLQCAWVITGSPVQLERDRSALQSLGLAFPEDYEKIVSVRHSEMEWVQTLWKPHRLALPCN